MSLRTGFQTTILDEWNHTCLYRNRPDLDTESNHTRLYGHNDGVHSREVLLTLCKPCTRELNEYISDNISVIFNSRAVQEKLTAAGLNATRNLFKVDVLDNGDIHIQHLAQRGSVIDVGVVNQAEIEGNTHIASTILQKAENAYDKCVRNHSHRSGDAPSFRGRKIDHHHSPRSRKARHNKGHGAHRNYGSRHNPRPHGQSRRSHIDGRNHGPRMVPAQALRERDTILALQHQISDLQHDRNQDRMSIWELNAQLGLLEQRHKAESERFGERLNRREGVIQNLQGEISQLKRALRQKGNKIHHLTRQKNQLRNQLAATQRQNRQLQEQLRQEISQKQQAMRDAIAIFDQLIPTLEMNAELQDDLTRANRLLETYKESLQTREQWIAILDGNNESLKAENAALRADFDSLKSAFDLAHENFKRSSAQTEHLIDDEHAMFDRLDPRIDAALAGESDLGLLPLSSDHRPRAVLGNSQQSSREALLRKLDQLTQFAQDREQECNEMAAALKALSERNNQLHSANERATQEVLSLREQVADLSQGHQQALATIDALKKDRTEREAVLGKNDQEIRKLKQQLELANREKDITDQSLTDAHKVIAERNVQLDDKEKNELAMSIELGQLRRAIDDANKNAAAKDQKIKELLQKQVEFRQRHSKETDELQAQIRQLQAATAYNEQRFKEYRTTAAELETEQDERIATLSQENDSLRASLGRADQLASVNLKAQADAAAARESQLNTELSALQSAYSIVQQDRNAQVAIIRNTRSAFGIEPYDDSQTLDVQIKTYVDDLRENFEKQLMQIPNRHDQELDMLTSELHRLQEIISKKDESLRQAKALPAALAAALTEKDKKLQALRASLAKMQRHLDQPQSKEKTDNCTMIQLTPEISELQEQVAAREAELNDLRTKLQDVTSAYQNAQRVFDEQNVQLLQFTAEIQALKLKQTNGYKPQSSSARIAASSKSAVHAGPRNDKDKVVLRNPDDLLKRFDGAQEDADKMRTSTSNGASALASNGKAPSNVRPGNHSAANGTATLNGMRPSSASLEKPTALVAKPTTSNGSKDSAVTTSGPREPLKTNGTNGLNGTHVETDEDEDVSSEEAFVPPTHIQLLGPELEKDESHLNDKNAFNLALNKNGTKDSLYDQD